MKISINPLFFLGIAIILSMTMLLTTCSRIHIRKRDPKCKALFAQIKADWFRDETRKLYSIRKKSDGDLIRSILLNKDCLKGLEHLDIERLFGKPDMLDRQNMVYFLQEPCLEKRGVNAAACHYLEFSFGKDRKVIGLDFTTTTFKD